MRPHTYGLWVGTGKGEPSGDSSEVSCQHCKTMNELVQRNRENKACKAKQGGACIPKIPEQGMPRQEDHVLRASLG